MIPGAASYKTLDKIAYLQQIAADPAQPDDLRHQATTALERIEAGNPVDALYREVREQAEAARGDRDADLHQARRRRAGARQERRDEKAHPAAHTSGSSG